MGVIMQAFYWDCPGLEKRDYKWWEHVSSRIPSLSRAGFTALWLPPASKGANIGGPSMGYDPYDYYDLGDIDQKGKKETWFGSKKALLSLIKEAHKNSMHVYADIVINHNNGADEEEYNPINKEMMWTKFNPGSGKFFRDWKCFHPSPYKIRDEEPFGGMPDLCHKNPYVSRELLKFAKWLIEDIGFDGFRYDCVKGFGHWVVRYIQEADFKGGDRPYGVGECWANEGIILEWLDETNRWSENPVDAFDFALRDRLKGLCDSYGYSLKNLISPGTLLVDRTSEAVTFVENHDIVRDNPIINDKMLAYAFILTHEGYPCVFWQDYYNWNLALEGQKSGIAALVGIHEGHAGGDTEVLYIDDDLYIMQRTGYKDRKGLIFVLNNRGDEWKSSRVKTQWENTKFSPGAWRGKNDGGVPKDIKTDTDGYGEFQAPPRGYAVYLPE